MAIRKNKLNYINLLVISTVLFLLYQTINNNKPHIIIKEKIIYKGYTHDTYDDTEDDTDDDEPYRDDIYKPDLKQATSFPTFNIKTRGPPEDYNMVGFIQDSDDSNKLQQLYGRRTYPNSNQWNYYVKSDQYNQIPIPININGSNCTDERGCSEVNDKDSINLFNKDHTATIYKPEPYYYNPYVN